MTVIQVFRVLGLPSLQALMLALIALGGLVPAAEVPTSQPATGMSYLDNGTLRVGVDLDLGGAITWVSKSGDQLNLVNSFDWGRQIQMSFYAGPIPFTPGGKQPAPEWRTLGWNPIQAGDHFKNRSKTIEVHNDGKAIDLKCIPMQWPLNNVPGECIFESHLKLQGSTVQAHCRIINNRSDTTQYAGRFQELPAIYTNGPWWRLMTYTGDKPFTHDALIQIPAKMPWTQWLSTENWAALVNDQNWGLGVWEPGAYVFSGGFANKPGVGGPKDNPTGYLTPLQNEILDSHIEYAYSYVLILGTLDEIRTYVYDHAQRPAPPDYHFEKDRQHWTYHDAADAGWPIKGELDVAINGKDPYLIGPAGFWKASDAPKLFIEAAFESTQPKARLRWKTHADNQFSDEKMLSFEVNPDDRYHVYAVDLSASPRYVGSITGLRIDPMLQEGIVGRARIKSISYHSQDVDPESTLIQEKP